MLKRFFDKPMRQAMKKAKKATNESFSVMFKTKHKDFGAGYLGFSEHWVCFVPDKPDTQLFLILHTQVPDYGFTNESFYLFNRFDGKVYVDAFLYEDPLELEEAFETMKFGKIVEKGDFQEKVPDIQSFSPIPHSTEQPKSKIQKQHQPSPSLPEKSVPDYQRLIEERDWLREEVRVLHQKLQHERLSDSDISNITDDYRNIFSNHDD